VPPLPLRKNYFVLQDGSAIRDNPFSAGKSMFGFSLSQKLRLFFKRILNVKNEEKCISLIRKNCKLISHYSRNTIS